MRREKTHDLCHYEVGLLERPRYFPRQLITPTDMTLEQRFFLDKLRQHNRLLHGWGIVCGCPVKQAKDGNGNRVPWTVEIEPGCILDPFGNEVLIESTVPYDLRCETANADDASKIMESDPWCSDVPLDRPANETLYVAVCYAECETRPVRAQPVGCGCDETAWEYSRIRGSYVIKALSDLPEWYNNLESPPPLDEFLACEQPRACPPCPTYPWVVLADVTPDAEGNLSVDCLKHRRYVLSCAEYYILCQPAADKEEMVQLEDRLRLHIDDDGMRVLEEEHGGALGAATELSITYLKDLGPTSEVGLRLEDVTVGDVAGMSFEEYEDFVEEKLENIASTKRRHFDSRARDFWTRAHEVELLTRPYRTK